MLERDTTVKTLECKYGMLADLVERLVKDKMELENEKGIVRILRKNQYLEFYSNRVRDPNDMKLYHYFDYAEGLHRGLIHGL